MSLFEKKKNSAYALMFMDCRTGSYKDQTVNNTVTSQTAVLDNTGQVYSGAEAAQLDVSKLNIYNTGVIFLSFKLASDGKGSYNAIYQRLDGATQGLQIAVLNTGQLLTVYTGAAKTSSIKIQYGVKYNIALVLNTNVIDIYVNGLFRETLSSVTFYNISTAIIHNFGTFSGTFMKGALYYSYFHSSVLTATEIATITSELNNPVETRAVSRAYNVHDGVKGDGSTDTSMIDYGDILDISLDDMKFEFELSFPQNYDFNQANKIWCLFGKSNVGSLVGRYYLTVYLDAIAFIFEPVLGTTPSITFGNASDFAGTSVDIKITIDRDGLLSGYINNNLVDSVDISASSLIDMNCSIPFSLMGATNGGLTKLTFPGKLANFKAYRNNILEFYTPAFNGASLTDKINNITPTYDSTVFTFDGEKTFNTIELPFKGETNALANERTMSSGFLENTGMEIESGSFKVIEENSFGGRCKKVVCVTNGDIELPFGTDDLDNWYRYIDDVLVTSNLSAPRTISMTAGQKLIWSSENHLYDLHQST